MAVLICNKSSSSPMFMLLATTSVWLIAAAAATMLLTSSADAVPAAGGEGMRGAQAVLDAAGPSAFYGDLEDQTLTRLKRKVYPAQSGGSICQYAKIVGSDPPAWEKNCMYCGEEG